jgi:CubicO group peptidase (beta-lactamase class C family)
LPGAGALQLRNGKITHLAVVGFRSLQSLEPMELTDQFHLGSATKAMTAVVAASLVEDGALSWDRPLSEVFPELRLDRGYASVTLADLASHRAGLPRDASVSDTWRQELLKLPTAAEQRLAIAARVLEAPPAFAPHATMNYSNLGYMILGLAIERAAKEPFERVMQERLFNRLDMKSCGFFAPGVSTTSADAPRGHDALGNALPPRACPRLTGGLHSSGRGSL